MVKVILFDIDKTMLRRVPSHRQAFADAFKLVYGLDTHIDVIEHVGMPDTEIIFQVLKFNGLTEQQIKPKLKLYLKTMTELFCRSAKKKEVKTMPGVKRLLKKLAEKKVLLGLVTGNIEKVAWTKLKLAGLDAYFKFGGFGSESRDRTKLIQLALKRARKKNNFKLKDVLVIGDSIRDVQAAQKARVKILSVATGNNSLRELKKLKPDFLLPDLANTKKTLQIMLS